MSETPLNRVAAAVDPLIAGIGDTQWSARTPCTEWTVRDVVTHLVGINQVFTAFLREQPAPTRSDNPLGDDPVRTYRASMTALQDAVRLPGALDRPFESPLGSATGAMRVNWRITDLLVHAWDITQATGQPLNLPEDLVEDALAFAREGLAEESRPGRFAPVRPVAEDAPAIERLVAFSGRTIGWRNSSESQPGSGVLG